MKNRKKLIADSFNKVNRFGNSCKKFNEYLQEKFPNRYNSCVNSIISRKESKKTDNCFLVYFNETFIHNGEYVSLSSKASLVQSFGKKRMDEVNFVIDFYSEEMSEVYVDSLTELIRKFFSKEFEITQNKA